MNTVQNKFKVGTITTVRLGHRALKAMIGQTEFDNELFAYHKKFDVYPDMVIYDATGNKLYFGQGAYGLKGVAVSTGDTLVLGWHKSKEVSAYEPASQLEIGLLQELVWKRFGVAPRIYGMEEVTASALKHLNNELSTHMKRIERMK